MCGAWMAGLQGGLDRRREGRSDGELYCLIGAPPSPASTCARCAATPGATSGTAASASAAPTMPGSTFATTADSRERFMTMHDKHRAWIEGRGIDAALAEKFGLETVVRGGKAWLAVPYREAGETVNHKYRLTSEKDHRMDDGAPLSLWNVDCLQSPEVRSGQVPVVITEGEWDALAAIQAGAPAVVSVPNGAPQAQT